MFAERLTDMDSETALLGNMILFDSSVNEAFESGVSAEDFYLDKHKIIFETIRSMHEEHIEIDSVTLSSRLNDEDKLDKIGGREYILKLTESSISSRHTKEYIRIILEKSFRRSRVEVGNQLVEDSLNRNVKASDLAEETIVSINGVINAFKQIGHTHEII